MCTPPTSAARARLAPEFPAAGDGPFSSRAQPSRPSAAGLSAQADWLARFGVVALSQACSVNDRRGSGKGATDPVSSARAAFAESACPCACVLRVCVLSAISAARLWGRGVRLRPLPPGTLSTRTAQAPATASICVASAPPSCQSVCAMHACVAGAATACRRCGLPARAAHCTIYI